MAFAACPKCGAEHNPFGVCSALAPHVNTTPIVNLVNTLTPAVNTAVNLPPVNTPSPLAKKLTRNAYMKAYMSKRRAKV